MHATKSLLIVAPAGAGRNNVVRDVNALGSASQCFSAIAVGGLARQPGASQRRRRFDEMKILKRLLAFALAAPVLAPAQTAYPVYTPIPNLVGDIRIVAESSAETLMTLWVEAFKKQQPALNLIVRPTSPLAAAPMVVSGAADLGFPARELWPYEEELSRKFRGHEAFVVLVGLGAHATPGLTPALGVFVHASNPLTRITLDQLDAIYSSSRRRGFAKDITTWGDLGATGEWAARPIHAVTHRMPNGIDYFVQKIVTKGADFKKSVTELPMRRGNTGPDELIAQAVAADPAAIGFGCFANAIPGMKTIALAGTAAGPFYAGTLDEVRTLRYPLARPIYLVIDRAPGQPIEPKLAAFLRFILSAPGQAVFAASGGWLPLPPDLAQAEQARLR